MTEVLAADRISSGEILAGKYELREQLGRGGMGVVYRAVHRSLQSPVAIKFLHHSALGEAERASWLMREARVIARLSSPHVPRIYDTDTLSDGSPYIVMELLKGRSLSEVVRGRGPLPLELALEYIRQACLGLQEAHALNIIHRDIKPSNLFLAQVPPSAEFVKVIDFGIAALLGHGFEGTASSRQKPAWQGSPPFMSPEQVRGEALDARSDVWSLGATLQFLLTGRGPFEGQSTAEVFTAILTEPPRVLRQDLPSVPAALQRLVSRCLQKPLSARLQSVEQLLTELDALQHSDSPRAPDRLPPASNDPPTITGSTTGNTIQASEGRVQLTGAAAEERTPGVALYKRDQACSYGWLDNVAVVVGRQPPTPQTVPNYRASIEKLIQLHSEGIGLITIVETTSTPEPAARDAIIRIFQDNSEHLQAALFVDNATGFRAAVHRGMGAGIIMALGRRNRIRIVDSLEAGFSWFSGRWQPASSTFELFTFRNQLEAFIQAERTKL